MGSIKQQIKGGKASVFRRAYIKRRNAITGLFETDWQEITDDVITWSKISIAVDVVRQSKFKFKNTSLTVENTEGKYNQEDQSESFWSGYASQQRTLVKIVAGYVDSTLGADGIWQNVYYPGTNDALWDVGIWNQTRWSDEGTAANQFFGLLYGDVTTSDQSRVTLPIKPLQEIFQDFPAQKLNHFTSTGMTAENFIKGLRDQTNGSGVFLFRPFFGDTTTNWNIGSTTEIYTQLNTTTGEEIIDKTVWDIVETLAESENFIAYVDRFGKFNFINPSVETATTYELFGMGQIDTNFGVTIKSINKYGSSISNFYNRVQVKFTDLDTETSYAVRETDFTITGTNLAWNLGYRTFDLTNFWIPNATVADNLALTIFNNVSGFKKEIQFNATFLPQMDVLNRVKLTYDTTPFDVESLWDLNNWDEMVWDLKAGSAIKLDAKEFKLLELTHDIERFETIIKAREV